MLLVFPRFRRLIFLFVCTAIATFAAGAPSAAEVNGPRSGKWAHEASPLQPDARVIWGRFDNGLRYALLPFKGVPGRVALRFLVIAGSLDEREEERGIAHFTEHMAFNGTKHFKEQEMVGFFQRIGIEYGSDVNAHTAFDHTAYSLDFRENDPELLREGLRLFRDFADGISFEAAEIESERGVILSEQRIGDTIAGKKQEASLPMVFRGLQFANRGPIGTVDLIRGFTREQFLKFYERCYRSDLMVVVAAGDFDTDTMTAQIREQFAGIARPAMPLPARDEGRLDSRKVLRAGVFKISDVGSAEVAVASVLPQIKGPDTRELQVERDRRKFALDLLETRLRTMLPGLGAASAGYGTLVGYDAAEATGVVSAESWARGLASIDEIIRATCERGFEQREIDMPRRRALGLADHMLEQLGTIDPSVFADGIVYSVTDNTVYIGLEREYAWKKEWLEALTAQDLQKSLRASWDLERMAFNVAGDVDIEGGAAEILKEVNKARREKMRELRPESRKESIYMSRTYGTPTAVVETHDVPELQARLLRFGNNVRVNFVRNTHEPGLVRAVVRVGTGVLDMPANKPALKEFGLQTLLASGTTHYTSEQIGEIAEDHFLEFNFDVGDHDAFTFRGLTGTEEFESFLGVVSEFLYKPRFDTSVHHEEKLKAFIGRVSSMLGLGEGMRELNDYLFKGDPRFALGTANDYIGMSTVDVRNWMQAPLTSGYVEATIVGDISEEQLVKLLSRTLGSLPARAAKKSTKGPPKPVKVTAPAGFERIEFIGEQHQAIVIGTWPVAGKLSMRDRAALHMLSKILEIRIRQRVREDLGLAYSPTTDLAGNSGYSDFELVQAMIDCAPPDSTRIAKMIEQIADGVAKDGVSQGEFIGSRGILVSKLRRAFTQNEFLVGILERAQERTESLEEAVALRDGFISTVELDDLNAWAKKILPASNSRTAAVVPRPMIGIFQTGGPAAGK